MKPPITRSRSGRRPARPANPTASWRVHRVDAHCRGQGKEGQRAEGAGDKQLD
ncbi:hypothetical protein ACFV2H_32320 [Streptomyces sp. NPDC059629]|uniref:hypothetical protein n=1 Tax=Streptomyces sp. NPDC059629 TaxID=3346889 RepID=UPI003686868B